MFVTENYICFYASFFGYTKKVLKIIFQTSKNLIIIYYQNLEINKNC